jgi:hypothetical protein
MAILSLIQRTASTLINREIKENILNLVLSLNDEAKHFQMIVHS